MTESVITLTPLYKCGFCSLLQIDGYGILLDCGWDERWDEHMLEPLARIVASGNVDAVLLSHPDVAHLGALPYVIGKLGLSCPVYCTVPVRKMGELFMYNAVEARSKYGFDVFSLDDVDKAFADIRGLEYSQEVSLERADIVITPLAAGNMLGATIWRISKESQQILYAVNFNHRRERHLDGTVLQSEWLARPAVLITDAINGLWTHGKRKERDIRLRDYLKKTLDRGGSVLMPVDAAGRVLELLQVLHAFWTAKDWPKERYSLVLLSTGGKDVLYAAQKLIEWMSDKIIKHFDEVRANPFSLPLLRVCHSKAQLDTVPRPMVCLATGLSLETSLAQEMFLELVQDTRNLILFTQRQSKWSLAHRLMQTPTPPTVSFTLRRRQLLQGRELREFLERQSLEREQKSLEAEKEDDDDEEDEGQENEDDDEVRAEHRVLKKIKLTTPSYPMFAYREEKRNWDEYGEVLAKGEFEEPLELPAELEGEVGGARPGGRGGGPRDQPWRNGQDEAADRDRPGRPDSSSSSGSGRSGYGRGGGEGAGPVSTMDNVKSPAAPEPPAKTISSVVDVVVRAEVQYVDMEGRVDQQDLQTILTHVVPHRLVLLHGESAARASLASFVRKKIKNCNQVLTPEIGQEVRMSSDSKQVRLNLSEELVKELKFVPVAGGYELAYVRGKVAVDYEASPVPLLLPTTSSKRGHPAVFMGEVRMATLKVLLQKNGIQADICDGVLVCCNGLVNVRKVNQSTLSVQGAVSSEYYKIRTLLYSQYQIL